VSRAWLALALAACHGADPPPPPVAPPPPMAAPAPPPMAAPAPPPIDAAAPRRPVTPRAALTVYRAELVPRHGLLSVVLGLGAAGSVEQRVVLDADALTLTVLDGRPHATPKTRPLAPADRDRLMAMATRAWDAPKPTPAIVTDYREVFVIADGDDTFDVDRAAPMPGGELGALREALWQLAFHR
jgi:hypothetical protein